MLSKLLKVGLLAGAVATGALVTTAAEARSPNTPCFFTNSWQGWSSPSPDVLLLRVNMHDVYRVELAGGGGGSSLNSAGYFLVNQVRGSNSICSALDLDLAVADHHGFYRPLIARNLTRLTPAEVAAIPKKYKP